MSASSTSDSPVHRLVQAKRRRHQRVVVQDLNHAASVTRIQPGRATSRSFGIATLQIEPFPGDEDQTDFAGHVLVDGILEECVSGIVWKVTNETGEIRGGFISRHGQFSFSLNNADLATTPAIGFSVPVPEWADVTSDGSKSAHAAQILVDLRRQSLNPDRIASDKYLLNLQQFEELYGQHITRSVRRSHAASYGVMADARSATSSIDRPESLAEVSNSGNTFVGWNDVDTKTPFVLLFVFERESEQLLTSWLDLLPLARDARSRRFPIPDSVLKGRDDLESEIDVVAVSIPQELVSAVIKLDEIESFLSMLGDSTQCQAQGLLSFDRKKLIPELQVWRERLLSVDKGETEGQQDEASAAGPGSQTDPAESSQQGRAAIRSRWVLPTSGAMAAAGGAALEDSRVTDGSGSVASIEGNTLGIYASVDQASGPMFAVHVAQRGREAEGPSSSFLVAVPLNSTRDARVGRVTGLLERLGVEQLDDLNFQVQPLEESELAWSDVQTLLDEDAAVRRVPELRGELQALLARLTESQSGD